MDPNGLKEPPIRAGFGNNEVPAVFVSVPETAVNENNSFILPKDNIRFPGKGFHIQPVTESAGKQELPYHHFRFGVLRPDPAHVVTSLGF